MISKVISPGKSFAGLCRYLYQKRDGAEVILSAGVRDYDHAKMAADFSIQASQNPRLSSPVLHIILSWPPGENLTKEQMVLIAQDYLENLQIKDTQYAAIRHNDRAHNHLHFIINRVSNNGKTIKDSHIGLRGKKVAQQLTRKYGLQIAERKHLGQINLNRLHGYDAVRYEVFTAIYESLPKCRNLEDLQQHLSRQQIQVLYKYKGNSIEIQGISFCKGELKFKGSEIDRAFSYGNLQKTFTRKQQQLLHKTRQHNPGISQSDHDKQLSQATKLLYELMKPEYTQDFVPNELIKNRKKRRKFLGL
jgi:transcriptional regulator NrdR family protein